MPKITDPEVDILKFWKVHEQDLPLLASFARGILSIPATSASSERAFSTTGNIVTTRRENLEPDRVEVLAYKHDNYDRVIDGIKSMKLSEDEITTAASKPGTSTTTTATVANQKTSPLNSLQQDQTDYQN